MIFTLILMLSDPTLTGVETPDAVAQWVAADLATIDELDREFMRYVWIPSWSDAKWHHALTFAINTAASRSGVIQHPTILANGWLQRWDIRRLVQTEAELKNLLIVWDSLQASEPYFHDPLTGLVSPAVAKRLVSLGPLAEAGAPVYRGDWFLSMLLTSIEGGRYLEFRGFTGITPTDSNPSEEAVVLSRFGLFEAQAVSVDGDRRVGMFRSGVTGKARSVIQLQGFVGLGWITEDIFDEDVDEGTHAIYNLLQNDIRGHEIIVEMKNGLHAFLITDQNGKILREAPPNLVTDHQVPAPYTKRLQGGAISCIRCHGSEDGLRSCSNDVAKLLAGPLRVLDDATVDLFDNPQDEIATRYSGRKFDRELLRGRLNYADAIDEVTQGQLNVQQTSDLVSEVYASWRYEMVTTEQALRELGFNLKDEKKEITPGAIMAKLVDVESSLIEDPAIAALYTGIPIRRTDFERVYSQLLVRSLSRRGQ